MGHHELATTYILAEVLQGKPLVLNVEISALPYP
jgi:hypothetical protein